MLAPLAPVLSRTHGRGNSVPYEYTWSKLAEWGGAVFLAALAAAYLRHWQYTRIARVQQAEALAEQRRLRDEWVRIARVAGEEGSKLRIAATARRASIDALPGIVLTFEDGTQGVLRAGMPVVGLDETSSGSVRVFEVGANEPFWIAARPAAAAESDDATHPFREMASTPELEPFGETYECAIGMPLRIGPALPSTPVFRPWSLLVYAVVAGVIALLPLETATPVGLILSVIVLFGECIATLLPFATRGPKQH